MGSSFDYLPPIPSTSARERILGAVLAFLVANIVYMIDISRCEVVRRVSGGCGTGEAHSFGAIPARRHSLDDFPKKSFE